ncbi:MAG: GvpL/GvpF family gas vesicle protein, partial [Chloroflexi bacterium]|nr:GvpL/GvpF family gas vesicle protein [Chloroflexota bacterium]
MGIYLYAIAGGAPRLALDSVGGVPDGTSACGVLAAAGLTAVTSDYQGRPFSGLSRPDVLSALLVHQQVLDRITSEVPVLPVKFGTVIESRDEARRLLERFHGRLEDALKDVGNSVEIDLSATWDLQTVFAEIGQTPAIVQARADVSPDSELTARILVGQLVQEELEERRERLRRRVVGGLLPLARDAQPNPRPSDDIVVNVAFLVERR